MSEETQTPDLNELRVEPAAAPAMPDLASFAVTDPSMVAQVAEKLITTVPVRKPLKTEFVRVNSDPDTRCNFYVYSHEIDNDRDTYLVLPQLVPGFPMPLRLVQLVSTVTRRGDFFLWAVPQPDPNQLRENQWNVSARKMAQLAEDHWLRIQSNRALGCYEAFPAKDPLDAPTFPDPEQYPFFKLVELAFTGGRILADLSHPLFAELEGRA